MLSRVMSLPKAGNWGHWEGTGGGGEERMGAARGTHAFVVPATSLIHPLLSAAPEQAGMKLNLESL